MEAKRALHPLRFAMLCRVSTAGQNGADRTGIPVQKEKLERCVGQLGGTVTKSYIGQESATPDAHRLLLDKLLADAERRRFDAVMVDDVSRWSRDNLKSEQGLKVLKDAGIRFYVGTMEYDLNNPMHKFMLVVGVGISEMYALTISEKSVRGKIALAERGVPAVGNLPWGRTYDKHKGVWGVDPDKREMLQRAAADFLAGTATMGQLERRTGLIFTQLYDLFNGKAGAEWTVHFRPAKFPQLAKDVTLNVPALLDGRTLRLLKRKIARGRAFYVDTHGKTANDFLLRKVLFCAVCGYAVSGASINGHRYYVHGRTSGKHKIPCRNFSYIPAQTLEYSVMGQLFEFFGDAAKRAEIVRASNANITEAERLRERVGELKAELNNVVAQQGRVVDGVARGLLPEAKVKAKMAKLLDQEEGLKDAIEELEERVASVPTAEELDEALKPLNPKRPGLTRKVAEEGIEWSRLMSTVHFKKMSFGDKVAMVRAIFGNARRTPAKKRGDKAAKFTGAGVYVEKTQKGDWKYALHGILPFTVTEYIDKDQRLKVLKPI
jgi:site-specific DNA recombinase